MPRCIMCNRRGWLLSVSRSGYAIKRCDECKRFETDDDARDGVLQTIGDRKLEDSILSGADLDKLNNEPHKWTCAERAAAAQKAVDVHRETKGQSEDGLEINDLVIDCMHLLRSLGQSYEEIRAFMEHAGEAFEAESLAAMPSPLPSFKLPARDSAVLDDLQAMLDRHNWDGDTMDEVAHMVRSTGRPVREVNDYEDDHPEETSEVAITSPGGASPG